ncbi:MAG: FimB/Mfa2 family fimbrial subunit [Dysgonamonadaceae bacterium]|jgi:hypothetical protein|nr:FimB/Mfa2 family fimbrial subunit [Dysgonamonadaceae bacterium]
MKSITIYIGTIACLAIFLQSCIKEDISGCPANLFVMFSYDESAEKNWSMDEWNKTTIFVFDENEHLISFWSPEEAPELNKKYAADFNLPAGKYNFVAWSNLSSPYLLLPDLERETYTKMPKTKAMVAMDITSDSTVDETVMKLPLLLYGHNNAELEPLSNNLIVIPLTQNTNRLSITIAGLPRTDDQYRFTVVDNNNVYSFDNQIMPSNKFAYTVDAVYPANSDELYAKIDILKLDANRSPALTVVNVTTNEQIFPTPYWTDNNIVSLITSIYSSNDFSKKHNYDIRITIDPNNGENIQISINGWALQIEPDINLTP